MSGKAGLGKGQLMGWTGEAAGSPGAPDFDHQGRCGPRRLHPLALPGGAGPGSLQWGRAAGAVVWGLEERTSSLWDQEPRAWGHPLPAPQPVSGVTVEGGRHFPRGSVTHSPLPLSWLAPPPLGSGVKTLPPIDWAGLVGRLAGPIRLGCGGRGATSGNKECGVR